MVVTTDLRLNEPRYASLPNIMKAKKKEILEIQVEDFNIDYLPRLEILKVKSPKERENNVTMLSDPQQLINALKEKEGII